MFYHSDLHIWAAQVDDLESLFEKNLFLETSFTVIWNSCWQTSDRKGRTCSKSQDLNAIFCVFLEQFVRQNGNIQIHFSKLLSRGHQSEQFWGFDYDFTYNRSKMQAFQTTSLFAWKTLQSKGLRLLQLPSGILRLIDLGVCGFVWTITYLVSVWCSSA